MTPKTITVTADSDSKTYDGTALTKNALTDEYENDIWAFSKLVKSHDTTSIIRALPCGGSCTDHVVITACKSGCTSAKLGIAFKCWLYQSAFTGVLHDMASIAEEMFDPEVVIGKNEMKVFDTSYFDEHYYRIVEVS